MTPISTLQGKRSLLASSIRGICTVTVVLFEEFVVSIE